MSIFYFYFLHYDINRKNNSYGRAVVLEFSHDVRYRWSLGDRHLAKNSCSRRCRTTNGGIYYNIIYRNGRGKNVIALGSTKRNISDGAALAHWRTESSFWRRHGHGCHDVSVMLYNNIIFLRFQRWLRYCYDKLAVDSGFVVTALYSAWSSPGRGPRTAVSRSRGEHKRSAHRKEIIGRVKPSATERVRIFLFFFGGGRGDTQR